MPESLFRVALNDAGYGFPAISTLRELCKTSITATAIRYATYSDDPVAIIVSSGQRIEYCFLSECLRDLPGLTWLRKGDPVPRNTETHEFNKNSLNIQGASTSEAWTNLDKWFDGAPSIEMKEDVVGLGSYLRTLTVLFTDQAIELEDDDL